MGLARVLLRQKIGTATSTLQRVSGKGRRGEGFNQGIQCRNGSKECWH